MIHYLLHEGQEAALAGDGPLYFRYATDLSLCQPGAVEKISVLPAAVIGNPVTTPSRILRWVGEWARRDPSRPHWHLGPVGVEPSLWGRGIGSVMLGAFCAIADGTGAEAYLETDKPGNVRFYQRFGFTVAESAEVLGVTNWFMSRAAGTNPVTKT